MTQLNGWVDCSSKLVQPNLRPEEEVGKREKECVRHCLGDNIGAGDTLVWAVPGSNTGNSMLGCEVVTLF